MIDLKFPVLLTVVFALAACTSNDTKNITGKYNVKPKDGRSIIIYGVGMEKSVEFNQFSITLDEYDVGKQWITGNCSHYNHVKSSVKRGTNTVKYSVFDVAPGHYIYSSFNRIEKNPSLYFQVPKNSVVYLADFIDTGQKELNITQKIDDASEEMARYKHISALLQQAESFEAPRPHIFICTP